MMSAGWSNEQTFERFYYKPTENSLNYGQVILMSFDENLYTFLSFCIFNWNCLRKSIFYTFACQ